MMVRECKLRSPFSYRFFLAAVFVLALYITSDLIPKPSRGKPALPGGFQHWSEGRKTPPGGTQQWTNASALLRRRLPTSLIIGVRKAGTRALLKFLSIHPSIQRAGKEVHFFDRLDHFGLGLDWYRSKMPPSLPNQITIEKTPAYFHDPQVAHRVYRYNPEVKLILVLRDPVVRAVSDYTQVKVILRRAGQNYSRFEDLVLRPDDSRVDLTYKPLQRSLYSEHMLRWLRHFPLSNFHFVSGENLVRRPWTEMRLVEDFLRIPNRISESHFYFNTTRGFYCLRGDLVGGGCLSNNKGRRHPRIDPVVIAKLRHFFAPFMSRFYQLTGQNFGWY